MTVLTVHPSLPVRSVKEFIALAQKRPKEILFGHAGYGSFIHLNTVLLESATGIQITQVPFKGGGPAVVGLVSGETHAMMAGIGDIIEQIKAKRARPLGVSLARAGDAAPGHSDDRGNLPGLRMHDLGQHLCAGGNPQGNRRSVERRDREGDARSCDRLEDERADATTPSTGRRKSSPSA